jgi:hypothetical protein
MNKEAMKLALEMVQNKMYAHAEMYLTEALAKQEQKRPQNCGTSYCSCIDCVMDEQEQGEPVAWKAIWGGETKVFLFSKPSERDFDEITPLYAMPKKRNPLTNEQITKAFNEAMSKRPKDASNAETNRLFVRAIEAEIEAMERTPRLDGSLINEGTKFKQEQGEPVCHICKGTGEMDSGGTHPWGWAINIPCECIAPQQRTWVGLDPEEIRKTNHHMVDGAYHYSFKQGAEWAEATLKEKNT